MHPQRLFVHIWFLVCILIASEVYFQFELFIYDYTTATRQSYILYIISISHISNGYDFLNRYMFPTEHGVMSLDIHPDHSNLFCTGYYDG